MYVYICCTEDKKGGVDRSSTVIAKEPEGKANFLETEKRFDISRRLSSLLYAYIFTYTWLSWRCAVTYISCITLAIAPNSAPFGLSRLCLYNLYTIAYRKLKTRSARDSLHSPSGKFAKQSKVDEAKNCNSLVLRAPRWHPLVRREWFDSRDRGIYARTSNPDSRRSVERGRPQLMVIAVIFRGNISRLRNFAESWILAHYYCYWR